MRRPKKPTMDPLERLSTAICRLELLTHMANEYEGANFPGQGLKQHELFTLFEMYEETCAQIKAAHDDLFAEDNARFDARHPEVAILLKGGV